ncbi:sel1 repeat family protein [Vandammella animalimorsus]|uniref:sel1 repeat family protein n=1 Tax=Vandammella animalimorsus TaxID=2029117 RepID=UPI001177CDDA|nr:sel1 repeat family protein [Vandammella animalimorsus]
MPHSPLHPAPGLQHTLTRAWPQVLTRALATGALLGAASWALAQSPTSPASPEQLCDTVASPLDPQRPPEVKPRTFTAGRALQDTIAACLKAIEKHPKQARYAYQLGNAYFLQLQEYELQNLFNHKGQGASRRDMAKAWQLKALASGARQQYRRAADAGYLAGHYGLALMQLHELQPVPWPALQEHHQALQAKAPALAHVLQGRWHSHQFLEVQDKPQAQEHLTQSRQHYQQAIDLGLPQALLALASSYQQPNKGQDGEKYLQTLAKAAQLDIGMARSLYARALYRLGRNEEADALLAELEQAAATDADARVEMHYLQAQRLINGHSGVRVNIPQAMELLKQAAQAGHVLARHELLDLHGRWQ